MHIHALAICYSIDNFSHGEAICSDFKQLATFVYQQYLVAQSQIEIAGDSNFPKHIMLTQIRLFHQEHSFHCLHYLPFRNYPSYNSPCLSKNVNIDQSFFFGSV